jgi:hypothetical protein
MCQQSAFNPESLYLLEGSDLLHGVRHAEQAVLGLTDIFAILKKWNQSIP